MKFLTALTASLVATLFVLADAGPGAGHVVQGSIFGFKGGCPHVLPWGGRDGYEFYGGGCDLVFLQNPNFVDGLGLDIHLRTKVGTHDRWWSFVEAAVVRVGEDIIEVEGREDCGRFWVNGKGENCTQLKPRKVYKMPLKMEQKEGFYAAIQKLNSKQMRFQLSFGEDGAVVAIETFQEFVRVDVLVSDFHSFGDSYGLVGAFPQGEWVGRDTMTIITNENDFVKEWQVQRNDTLLFHDDYDTTTRKRKKHCAIESKDFDQGRNRQRQD